MIRAFYAGDYVDAFRGVRALPVGKAIVARIFG
jgi:cellulose synthase (UDP-forming)